MKEITAMPKQPLVVFAYARYSSNNQREESIDAQLRAIREHCERNNMEIIEAFVDEAQTGKNDDRDNFRRMINSIIKGNIKVDAILVHKFNRFARSKFDSVLHKKRLKDVGVRVISVTQNIDDTPEGAMLEAFLEAMDEYYSANLALEVQKGLRENALNGKHTGGKCAFGLSVSPEGKYVPNESAALVRRIFTEYANEVPKAEICERLNQEGHRNQRGNTFNVRTIYDMLRNEKYIGNYIYTMNGNETIRLDGIIDPIIDIDLWDRVQKLCNQPVKARLRHQKTKYFLTGKTFCALCGKQICGAGSKRMRNGDLYYYYKCVGKQTHKICNNPSLNKKWFEDQVFKVVVNTVFDDAQIKQIAKLTYQEILLLRQTPAISTETLKKQLSSISGKQAKLTDLYLDGMLDKEMLDNKLNEIKRQKRNIENEIEKRKAADEASSITENIIYDYVQNYVEMLKKGYTNKDEEFMRSVFTTFVDKVIVDDASISVFVNADFSILAAGDNKKFAGALRRLSPIRMKSNIPRKSSIFARNE